MISCRLRFICSFVAFNLLARLPAPAVIAGEGNKKLAIHYEWRPDTETRNGSVVSIVITDNHDSTLTFSMPAWTPGAYRVAEYGRQVREVTAMSNSKQALRVDKLDVDSWQVRAGNKPAITFTYRVEKSASFFGGTT